MRLIDVDALIQKVKEEEDERHLDKDDASLLYFFIECYAEPVDAIPVEWIAEWVTTHDEFSWSRMLHDWKAESKEE